MAKRYNGRTGEVRPLGEPRPTPPPPPMGPERRPPPPPSPGPLPAGLWEQLRGMLPGPRAELETEDWILFLILYLLYRETGESELLLTLGAMLFL